MPTPPKTAAWIAHPADRRNVARALAAPLLLFTPFAVDWFAGYEIVYAIVAFTLIGDTNYLLHLHIHRPFSRKPSFNLVLDLSMAAAPGADLSAALVSGNAFHHALRRLPQPLWLRRRQ
jgi:hypothetical protein